MSKVVESAAQAALRLGHRRLLLGTYGLLFGALPHCCNGSLWGDAVLARRGRHREGRVELAGGIGHPASRHGALCRVLEPKHVTALRVFLAVDLDSVDGVVQHAHDRPRQLHWLTVLVRVEGTAADLLGILDALQVNLRLPPGPAPMLVCGAGSCNVILWPRQICDLPGLAGVQRDLCADDLVTSAGVGIPTDLEGGGLVICAHMHKGVVARLKHGRVDVHVVDDVLWLVPPTFSIGQVGIHMGRQDAVVEVVVVVLRRLVGDPHGGEPLDHAPANATREKGPQRGTMVRSEELAILLEGEEHVTLPIQRPADVNGGAVGAGLSLRELTQGALEVHEAMLFGRLGDAEVPQEIAQPHTSPHGVAHGTCAPVEADRLLRHVPYRSEGLTMHSACQSIFYAITLGSSFPSPRT